MKIKWLTVTDEMPMFRQDLPTRNTGLRDSAPTGTAARVVLITGVSDIRLTSTQQSPKQIDKRLVDRPVPCTRRHTAELEASFGEALLTVVYGKSLSRPSANSPYRLLANPVRSASWWSCAPTRSG